MDQSISYMEMAQLAAAAVGVSMAGRAAKTAAGTAADGQFQKLLDQHAKTAEKPAQSQAEQEKDKAPAEQAEGAESQTGEGQKPQMAEEDAAQKPEDPLEQVKRLAEQGYAVVQPSVGMATVDGQTYQAGEYVTAWKGEECVTVPVVGVEPEALEEVMESQVPVAEAAAQAPEEAAVEPRTEQQPQAAVEQQPQEEAAQTKAEVVSQPQTREAEPQREERTVTQVQSEAPKEQTEDTQQAAEDVEVKVTEHDGGAQPLFHDVKAAPVKVAENYQPQQAEDAAGQVAEQLIPALEQGQTKVELQLTPATLGTVKVEITQSESGALHIVISAENSQTKNLLEKHTDSLQTMLAGRGQGPVEVEVRHQEEAQQHQGNPYDGHNGQNGGQQEQQQHRPRHSENSQDFLHQLRLGLVDMEDEA